MIASRMKNLALVLKQAEMRESPDEFVKKTFVSSLFMAMGAAMFIIGVFRKLRMSWTIIICSVLIIWLMTFLYFLRVPEAKIMRKRREISKEIVFAGRFLIIEVESGISIYNAMVNISRSFDAIGREFKQITDRIDLGTDMETSINEAVMNTSDPNLSRILWQILNVLQTGADISNSLTVVIEAIIKEQTIEINEYGKRLNPLSMFYMILTVIMPSLGVTGLIVASSFLSINLELIFLLSMVGFLGFIQFMFVAIIKSSRPGVEL